MPLDIGGGYGSSPRKAVESQAGKLRPKGTPRRTPSPGKYSMPTADAKPPEYKGSFPENDYRRSMSENELRAIAARREQYGSAAPRGLREMTMAGPVPFEDTEARGGPQRPKIRDVGDGMVEIRGYHATKSPEGWKPRIEEFGPLHIGTERAALHRMAGVEYGDPTASSLPGGIRSRYQPHGLFEITARAPREEVFGLQMPVTDDAANSLAMIPRDPNAGRNPSLANPEGQRLSNAVRNREAASVAYRNQWEDPGSLSHIVTDPGSITNVRRIYDAATPAVGLMSLLGTAAQFIPGFAERMPRTNWLANGGPLGDVMQGLIERAYAPGGPLDPYRNMRNMAGFDPQTGTVPA